jgi:serine/threonine protein kinase
MQDNTQPPDQFPRIENIEIIELAGQGGMSLVYKARQKTLDRIVALKVLSGPWLDGEEGIKRFQKEAQLTSTLKHPNIVKTLSFGVSEAKQPYLVMEFLPGNTLAEELDRNGPLKLQDFRDIFLPVLAALEEAHRQGIVHRDVKPGNIMICRTEGALTVKLLDFGIARLQSTGASTRTPSSGGKSLGSPSYMSPEQCRGTSADCRSDIYSLSCVMYEALCGEPPFTGITSLEVMDKHFNQSPPSVSELSRRIDIRKELAALVLGGLAKNPDDRPQSAAALSASLSRVLETLTLERVPRLQAGWQEKKSRNSMAVAVMVTLLMVAAFSYWFTWNEAAKSKYRQSAETAARCSQATAIMSEAIGLERADRWREALPKFESVIRLLGDSAHQENTLARAYIEASCCLQYVRTHPSEPAAENLRLAADEQGGTYADKAMALARSIKDKNLYEVACYHKVGCLSRPAPKVDKILELVRQTDRFCQPGAKQSLAIRDIALESMSSSITTAAAAEPLATETLKLCRKKYGEHTYETMRAKSNLVLLLAAQGKTRQSDLLAEEVGPEIVESRGLSIVPELRHPLLNNKIFWALCRSGNVGLLKKLLAREIDNNSLLYGPDQQWMPGSMYEKLSESCLKAGDLDEARNASIRAYSYYKKDTSNRLSDRKRCLEALLSLCRQTNHAGDADRYEKELKSLK